MTTLTTIAIGEWRVSVAELPDSGLPFRFRAEVRYCIGDKSPLYFCPVGVTQAEAIAKLKRLVGSSRSISPREKAEILTAVEDVPVPVAYPTGKGAG